MIVNRQRAVRIRRDVLAEFLASVRKQCRLPSEAVTVALVGEREIARLNWQFRGKHGPTDVLSFPAANNHTARNGSPRARKRRPAHPAKAVSDFAPAAPEYLGDIAIAPAVARRHARRAGRPLHDELCVLILHGVLHLLGYDHETDSGEMCRLERRLRRRLGIGAG
jgi:probable rRNA maturation factor